MANQQRHSYVQFYPSDWIAGLAFMPPMAEWLYLQICLYNWDKREPLPHAQARLRLSRSSDWEADLEALIDAGKVVKTQSGGLFVERAMIEANRAFDLWERKSRGGKRGANQTNTQQSSKTPDKTLGGHGGGSLGSNENENENENESIPNGIQGGAPVQADLIDNIDPDIWKAFVEHRIKLKAPITDRAATMLRNKLHEFTTDHGHNPNRVLEQSILRGWKGVFPLKDDDSGNGKRSGWRFDDDR